MSKNIIRLTESELKRMIVESVKNIISELDWKTYANAAKKSEKFVDDNWDSDFRDGDKLATDKDLWKRREKYYRRRDSIDKFLNMADKKHVEKYPDMNGIGGYPSRVDYALKNGSEVPRYGYFGDELRNDEMQRAQDEVMDFYNGKYEYTKGKGWHLPESIVSKAINESFKSIIKEQNGQTWRGVKGTFVTEDGYVEYKGKRIDYDDLEDWLYEEIQEYTHNTGERYIEGDILFYTDVIDAYVDYME